MGTQENRATLDQHWDASASGDLEAEHEIYDDNVVCEYPQSGEKIRGRRNLQALRGHHPGKPSGFSIRRIVGANDLWVTEYVINYEDTPLSDGQHYGVSSRQGHSRNPILRRALRTALMALTMGGARNLRHGMLKSTSSRPERILSRFALQVDGRVWAWERTRCLLSTRNTKLCGR